MKKTLLLTPVILLLFISINAQPVTGLPNPFNGCQSTSFQSTGSPVNWQSVNLSTATTTSLTTYTNYFNAIGYNVNDNLIYGIVADLTIASSNTGTGSKNSLVVIGTGNTMTTVNTTGFDMTTVSNSPSTTYQSGDVNNAGFLYAMQGSVELANKSIVKIDVNSSSSTFRQVTNIGTVNFSSPTTYIGDFSFYPGSNNIAYTVDNSGKLFRIDVSGLTTSTSSVTPVQVTTNGTIPASGNNEVFGASYFDKAGNLYVKGNTTGKIFKIAIGSTAIPATAPVVSLFGQSSVSSANDGASCPQMDVITYKLDFGDAPSSYGTLLADNGPRHLMQYVNGTLNPFVRFGANISDETDARTPLLTNATSDTYDDGVASFPTIAGGTIGQTINSYKVDIKAYNNRDVPAYIYGWIDWNNNGTFESGERVGPITVPKTTTTLTTYSLTWNNATLTGSAGTKGTYARFRISANDGIVQNPTGEAPDGEVEDYYIAFTTPLPAVFDDASLKGEITGNKLLVNWKTLTETNNDHFEIEVSIDGVNFTKVAEVKSLATGGNSSAALQYNYTIDLGATSTLLWGGLAFLAAGLLMFNRRNKVFLSLLLVAAIGSGIGSCKKTSEPLDKSSDGKLFVRIAQVDNDGTKSYSKIFAVYKAD